ncbi:MAG: dipeptidase PepV [Halanaerobiales bacterium]|nr:dipeptidase PepV [Halanaerobiales bacterium]
MDQNLKEKVDNYKEDIINSLQEIVQIKSVEAQAKEGMPFGEGVDKSLRRFLEIAEDLGLKTKYVDGYAGHVEIGEGEETLGILCHLDVVPEGTGWTYPPYNAEIHDNKMYGRGTIDDKGPVVASLYALKAIKDSDLNLNKKVRLILGTDEESGWEGLEYYFNKESKPEMAFSPDAQYPVIHAEKGILIFDLNYEFESYEENYLGQENYKYEVLSLKGGNAPNMVPDNCEILIKTDYGKALEKKFANFKNKYDYDINLSKEGKNKYKLISSGVSAHGSMPEKGKNAISRLLAFLGELDKLNIEDFIDFYNNKIGLDSNGERIGCNLNDEVSGNLIFNVGQINFTGNLIKTTVNIRYPVTKNKDEVLDGIKDAIDQYDVYLEMKNHQEPLYVPKNDPLVQNLMDVYRKVTGDNKSNPIAIGGGTYARAVPKGVAFGALFPGEEELAHQKDEYIDLENLHKNALIIASAIKALTTEK